MFELNDPAFYNHCQNNNMDLKLWEKKDNSLNELLNIPVTLHPFYDAFSNPNVLNQFYKEKVIFGESIFYQIPINGVCYL